MTSTIRTVFESLAASGWGRTHGEGAEMVYIPYPDPNKSVDVVDAKLSKTSTAVTPSETGTKTKVDGIDEIDQSPHPAFWHQPEQQKGLQQTRVVVEGSRENHQFINSESQMLVEQGRSLVDSDIQLDHQPSTESELNSDDPDDDPPGGDGGSPVTPATNPPSDDKGGELLNEQQMPAWHSRLNACKTLDDAMEFHTAIHCLSQKQREQLELSVPQERWVWLWSLPGVEEEPLEPQPEPLTQSDLVLEPDLTVSKPQPTLSELKALLNACDSLVQLNELKRKHKKTIDEAYDSMSEEEQAHVDAIRALAVPYKVFKYLGEEIKLGTERLHRGMLVYIDPQTHVRATASSVPVWAINGVSAGWKRPIDVSLSVLREVVKVVCKSQNQDGDQQLGLI